MASVFGGTKQRKGVHPVRDQNPDTALREHIVKNVGTNNTLVQEYNVLDKQRPTSWWKKDLNIPQWLVALALSLTVVVFTAFSVFASIVTLNKQLNGGACKVNSDCRQDRGLMCNNYRCGCAYSHFWSDTYQLCERRRMINRTCTDDSICDALSQLVCQNVTLSGGGVQLQCQCQGGMHWINNICQDQGLFNATCTLTSDCDNTNRYLYCDTSTLYNGYGRCNCNSSMFWNGDTTSGTCEYKRTVNQYCKPYDSNWCDDTGPVGQGLICADYTNPYGSEYGVCQCDTYSFYNGSASLANGSCVPLRTFNQSCASPLQCDYRLNLTCTNNLCACSTGYNYNPLVNSSGMVGSCQPAGTYLSPCSVALPCSTSAGLYCNAGLCDCNSSWSYWDGLTCASKLSIGGQCSTNTQCISAEGLFCSNYTATLGTCDCTKSYYWNGTCTLKLWYGQNCSSGANYVCDDNRGLRCEGSGNAMFQECTCYNGSYIWDSLYINRTQSCILKLSYLNTTCYGNAECQEYNYLVCVGGVCVCNTTDYWDGNRCQPKRNYTDPCNYTYECRDFNPVDLVCRLGTTSPPAYQCLCNTSSYWEVCAQECLTSKSIYQQCTLTGNCTSTECDIRANLQCLNDTFNTLPYGRCNCTQLQWWNGTYCRDKGTPAWGSNSSAVCNATYQCADYNLVSCPLGSSSVASLATCECATTKYWNGNTCIDRVVLGQSCMYWTTPTALNTSTCLSAAGAGLLCNGATCVANGTCTGGTCACPTGTTWNSTFLICASTSTGR